MTLFGKARLAVLSVAHSLLDKAINLDSVEAVKQLVRDLEVSIAQIQTALAEARGAVVTATREKNRYTTDNARLDKQIDGILGDDDPNNDHLATSLQAKFNSNEQLITAKQDEINASAATVQALEEVFSQLEAKHTAMVAQIQRLDSLQKQSRAKESAAAAITAAGQISGQGADIGVDNIAAGIERKADVADQKLKAAMGTFGNATDRDEQLAGVAAALAARKSRLKSGTASV